MPKIYTATQLNLIPPPHAVGGILKSTKNKLEIAGSKNINNTWNFIINNPQNTPLQDDLYIDWRLENDAIQSESIGQWYFVPLHQLPLAIVDFELNTLKAYYWRTYDMPAEVNIDVFQDGDNGSLIMINNSPFKQPIKINGEEYMLPPLGQSIFDPSLTQFTLATNVDLSGATVELIPDAEYEIDLNGNTLYFDQLITSNNKLILSNGIIELGTANLDLNLNLENITLNGTNVIFNTGYIYNLNQCRINAEVLEILGQMTLVGNKYYAPTSTVQPEYINGYTSIEQPYYSIMINTFAVVE
jgi:hypothetical protein